MESTQDRDRWLSKQLKEANDLVGMGGQALRRGQTAAGAQALAEAEAILDMAEVDSHELLKTRARVFNELGVVHQRQGRLDESKSYHKKAAGICDELIEAGDNFAANSAATHLNLSSIHLALGEVEKAQECGEKALGLLQGLSEAESEKDEDGDAARRGPDPLELGALQNLAVIYARKEQWEKANESMAGAQKLALELAAAGQKNFLAQLAQGCQQLSVIEFEHQRFDDALRWGRAAEELSEQAYEALGSNVLPVYIISQLNLISYQEKMGNFADAEDSLWKALEVAGNDPRILQRGVIFYETCRKQADPRLEEGNLPRDEVDAGYEELMERVEAAGGLKAVQQKAQQGRKGA